MATYASARAAAIAAIDELDAWQGQPLLSAQLASVSALQTQVGELTTTNNNLSTTVTTRTNERDAARRAVTAMKEAANAEKTIDASHVAGQAVLDAAAAEGL